MNLIGRQEALNFLEVLCLALDQGEFDYLVYGSVAFTLITGDDMELHDIDIAVRESDFDRLESLLSKNRQLGLNPIRTPVTIHANSLVYRGSDDKPFDVSLDSFEHYFQPHGLDLLRHEEFGPHRMRVMAKEDLILVYEIGLRGGNRWKIEDYSRKLAILRASE